MLTLLDLCCGKKGGWAKGFLKAGWDVPLLRPPAWATAEVGVSETP